MLSQHIFPNLTIYNVKFSCLGGTTPVNYTKAKYSGIINGYNNSMPYNVTVRVSNIQCYNSTGVPVAIGQNTTFYGTLWMDYSSPELGQKNYIPAALIEIHLR
jgi:hypothetical protein